MSLYRKYLTGTTAEAYNTYLADRDVLDLTHEMGLLKAHLARELEKPAPKGHLSRVRGIVDDIRRMSETIGKNMEHARGYIPVSFFPILVEQIAELVNREVKDEDALTRLRAAFARIALPANSREAGKAALLLQERQPQAE